MGLSGLEPPTSRLSGVRSNRLSYKPSLFSFHVKYFVLQPLPRFKLFLLQIKQGFICYGDGEIRTLDPLLARQVLSQLSYAPSFDFFIFLALFSYLLLFIIRQPPALPCRFQQSTIGRLSLNRRVRDVTEPKFHGCLS